MIVLLFILILLGLVVGHEFGHFFVAKLSGMEVPEFGIGFPPRLWGKKIGNTEYTVNALPFGGFVKITGEDMTDETETNPAAFSNRPKYAQALTLLAGPFSNIFIAFLLSSVAFMVGVPAGTDAGYSASQITGARILVVDVVSGSPAERAGIQSGDEVVSLTANGQEHAIAGADEIPNFVQSAQGPVALSLVRDGLPLSVTLSPEKGVVSSEPNTALIGIATAAVGTLHLSFWQAIGAGFNETIDNFKTVFMGILSLIAQVFTFSANFGSVAGPVGIARLVGDAASFGLGSVLSFVALISMNLGVINLFPFPALDGGRFAFLAAETLSRKKIPAKFANIANTVGFALLILLMVVITAHDVFRIFS